MTPFASRPRFDTPAVSPYRILLRRVLVFAVLLLLTSGLRGVPDKLHSTLERPLVRQAMETTGTESDVKAAMRALRDADNAYFLFEWQDRTRTGNVIPAVVIEKSFTVVRDGVVAIASLKDGRWRMGVKRKLDSGTGFSLPIAGGISLAI